jgi:hypothetical protein
MWGGQVEYYPPEGMGMETADEEQYVAGGAEGQEPTPGTATRSPEISQELAALGVYCRSMKPPKDWIARGTSSSFSHVHYAKPARRVHGATTPDDQHQRVRAGRAPPSLA